MEVGKHETVLSNMSEFAEESILFPRRISMPNLLQGTYKTEMKEKTKKVGINETCFKDRREFEEESVTPAHQVSILTGENIKKDEGDSHSLRAESKIGKGGGTLDIPNTGVSLEIPPGALRRDYCIQMRIISHHDTALSFASNSSIVVELLPNNVKLLKPATLTLPHHLVLKKKCGWKAKGYSSHHKEGNQPQWEEERNAQCDVTYRTCGMRLYNFSWKKFEVGEVMVEAKKIILFAAMRSSFEDEIFIDIGYYWQLPSCREILNENRAIVLHEIPVVFYKHGQLPLTILFQKVEPPHWICNEGSKAKEISFSTVAIRKGSFCTFILKRGVSDETDRCSCFIKAGQGSDLVNLLFPLNVRLGKLGRTSPEPLVVTNVKEMKEDTEEFVKNKRRLSDKRKFEEGSNPSAEAITPSTGNDTADLQEELPSAISKTRVRNNFLQDLSENIGKCWMDVGRKLQLTEEQLENLEQKGYPTLKEKIYQMLLVWKRKRGRAATYDVLADALRKAGRVDLQEELLEKYQPT